MLPQYEDDSSVSSPRSAASRPRIILQESSLKASSSPDRIRNLSRSPSLPQQKLSSSLVRHDDPFLPVERAAKNLERLFQRLLDAQSEGLSAGGIGMEVADDVSSVGSPTPTPSMATTPVRSSTGLGPKTIPIRQPKTRKITLRGARRGLEKSMREFAALKQHELSLIDQEVMTRNNALKQVSDLDNRRQLLEDEIYKIKSEEGPIGLRSEVEVVGREIQQLEATLLELRSKHRILLNQLREAESSKDSEMSSYTETLALNENQVKSFLRRPPVPQSLNVGRDPGMYALQPERRTLQMAWEQWTTEVGALSQRKASAESEKYALEQGCLLWRDVVQRVRDFEKDLKTQTRELAAQSQSQVERASMNGGTNGSTRPEDVSMQGVLNKLCWLISSLEHDLQTAESKDWKLLVCAIGAELEAFEQARDLLQETAGIPSINSESDGQSLRISRDENSPRDDGNHHETPSSDLSRGQLEDMLHSNSVRSPGESSNHSLEDTLREFGTPLDKGKQKADDEPTVIRNPPLEPISVPEPSQPRKSSQQDINQRVLDHVLFQPTDFWPKPPERAVTSESEDDEPGPEFLLSHS